jgi:hypothetical protein
LDASAADPAVPTSPLALSLARSPQMPWIGTLLSRGMDHDPAGKGGHRRPRRATENCASSQSRLPLNVPGGPRRRASQATTPAGAGIALLLACCALPIAEDQNVTLQLLM